MKSMLIVAALAFSNAALACDGPPKEAAVDVSKAEGTQLALDVTGMKCGSCSGKVTAALNKVDGVNAVNVNHETGKAEIAYDDSKTNPKALIATITALNFKAEIATDKGTKKEG